MEALRIAQKTHTHTQTQLLIYFMTSEVKLEEISLISSRLFRLKIQTKIQPLKPAHITMV